MYSNRNGTSSPAEPVNHLVQPLPPLPRIGGRAQAPNSSLDDLRRQQEAFHRVRERLDRQNGWMVIPALAPVIAPIVLESAAAALAGRAVAITRPGPLDLVKPGISPRLRGENIYARAGRQAHNVLKERVKAKEADGWRYEPDIENSALKPDVGTPPRDPANPARRYYLELKPDTPSGRRAAAQQIRRYKGASKDNEGRGIFYDPKDFLKDLP